MSIDIIHTNDEALRDYNEHLRLKAQFEAEAAALIVKQVAPLSAAQRDEPHEYIGFGD